MKQQLQQTWFLFLFLSIGGMVGYGLKIFLPFCLSMTVKYVTYIFICLNHYYRLFTWRLAFSPNPLPEISVIRIGVHYTHSWLLVLIYPLASIYALSQLKVNGFSQGHFNEQ